MTTPEEIEIKLEVAPGILPQLRKLPALCGIEDPAKHSSEVSVYFDTNKHKLRRKGLMLRVRRIGRRYIQTIKAAESGGAFVRGEWESEIAGEMPDLSLAGGTALEPLVGGGLQRKLRPLFETRVKRTAYSLNTPDRAIELTIDEGKIDAGSRSAPLCEVELELKRGNLGALFDVARDLTRTVPARLMLKSKSERGYALLDNELRAPIKTAAVNIGRGTSTRESFGIIGRACLGQIVGNEYPLLEGDPEGIHQMRVGLRRLRAALSLFGEVLADPQSASIKRELKWLTGELAPARQLDVLTSEVLPPVRKRHARGEGISTLSEEIARRRQAAAARVEEALSSERYRVLMLDIAAWLTTGDWTNPADDLPRDRGDIPIEVSAAAQLHRRWKKVCRKGKAIARLDAASRHKLRIQAKKIRYATEFFVDVFPSRRSAKRREKFLGVLKHLQKSLGDLNDVAAHQQLMAEIAVRHPRLSRNGTFAAGLLTGREEGRLDSALAAASAACAEVAQVKPYWR